MTVPAPLAPLGLLQPEALAVRLDDVDAVREPVFYHSFEYQAGTWERPRRIVAKAVCEGKVGGVFALEASRLARNNRDWHYLIDLCALAETLVIDHDGTYDPRLLNDRLLLGLKGTMSEFELGLIGQRAQEALREKMGRGEVLTAVPVG